MALRSGSGVSCLEEGILRELLVIEGQLVFEGQGLALAMLDPMRVGTQGREMEILAFQRTLLSFVLQPMLTTQAAFCEMQPPRLRCPAVRRPA